MGNAGVAPRCEIGFRTDIGRVRRSNQDSAAIDEDAGVYVVCDGMGGAAGGEIASRVAADTFLEVARLELASGSSHGETTGLALRRAVAAANRAVLNRAAFDTRFRGMGTTLVGFRVQGEDATVINVGDSRAYLVRNGIATRLTLDHSFVAEGVRRGVMTEAQAEKSSLQSVITRAIGADQDVHPDVFHQSLRPDDVLLLTSDGLTRHVTDAEIGGVVRAGLNDGPDAICSRLIECANARGGSDNITCLLLHVREGV